jgi:hypothetical protein
MSRARALVLAVLLVVTAQGTAADEARFEPLPVGLRSQAVGAGRLLDLVLPGPVVAALVVGAEEGKGGIFLLTHPLGEVDGPRTLHFLDPRGEGRLETLRQGLPGGLKALAALDLDGDGAPELLASTLGQLFSLGRLDALAGSTTLTTLLERPGFDLRSVAPEPLQVATRAASWLAVAEPGRFRLYRANGQGGVVLAGSASLPTSARRGETGLALTSPAVSRPLGAPAAEPIFAAGPSAFDRTRLRSVLLTAGAEGVVAEESWSRLPAPEDVEESRFLWLDGKPVLVALAQSADELNLFENKRLRVFPWRADRTRLGKLPLFQYETSTERWYPLDVAATDLDRDGRQDLVLLAPKGLSGDELRLEALAGLGGGRFSVKARRSVLDPAPAAWSFGGDLSGDGTADLLALEGGTLSVFSGVAKGDRVIERKPFATVTLPAEAKAAKSVSVGVGSGGASAAVAQSRGFDQLLAIDLDQDGRAEALALALDYLGHGRLLVWRLGAQP